MENKELATRPANEIAAEARTEVDSYKALVDMTEVASNDDYERANRLLTDIRDAEVKHEAERVKITQPMNQALRAVNALFKPLAEDLGKAKDTLGRKMMAWTRAEQARREEAERQAAEERRQAQAAADALVTQAVEAMAEGDPEAEAKLEEARAQQMMADVSLPVAHVAPPPSKGGHAGRVRYVAEVTDLPAFLRHVAASLEKGEPMFIGAVEVALGKLNTMGTATSGSLVIPGITFTRDEKVVARKSK